MWLVLNFFLSIREGARPMHANNFYGHDAFLIFLSRGCRFEGESHAGFDLPAVYERSGIRSICN